MSIKKIIIRNFKSIENLELLFQNKKSVTCFLGKNGVGKTNLFNAIEYFYENLDSNNVKNVLDVVNTYNSTSEISIIFDLSEFNVKINNGYLENMFSKLCKDAQDKRKLPFPNKITADLIKVTLIQNKNGSIKWNQKIEVRKIIKKIFPLYVINTRNLDLLTWNQVWNTIGDLSASAPSKADDQINEMLDKTFNNIYAKKYQDSKEIIEKTFNDNNISLDKYHFESRFKYMFMTRFNGENFIKDGHSLDFYSDGLNSYTYIKILVSIICKISDISCKSPIIVLDEPEIGLHEAKIEELIESITDSLNNNSFILINTHSPKLISELVLNGLEIGIYRLYLHNLHTVCKKLNTTWLMQQKHIITPRETACYFSDYLLFVEGETEYQLFNNKSLKNLFPYLKDIHIYPYNSNNAMLKYVYPKYVNIGIPYYIIFDIDKIVGFHRMNNKSAKYKGKLCSDDTNPLNNKNLEKSCKLKFFNKNQSEDYNLYVRINKIIKTQEFEYKSSKNYVDDALFADLLEKIKNYCEKKNVCINSSTIEGELINQNNIEEFLEFCTVQGYDSKTVDKLKEIDDIKEKVALTRLFFEGRLDLQDSTLIDKQIFNQVQSLPKSKADGWVNLWINYFWENIIKNSENKVNCFRSYFPSFYHTLQCIKFMIQ